MPPYPVGVSFLICTYNGASRLNETLGCLARQAAPAGIGWEAILVDNASTDGSTERARQVWQGLGAPVPLHLLHEPRPGKQYALEKAIEQVQYCYTCIVDDDNRLAPDYLRVGFELLENNPQAGILGGQSEATFEGTAPAWFPAFQHCYAAGPQLDRIGGAFAPLADGNIGHNVLWGAGMFVRTAVWRQLRAAGFQSLLVGRLLAEANLTGGEDDELCYAAMMLGYEVWYSSRLHLRHHMAAGRLTEAYRDRLFYDSARSTARLNAYRNALWGKPGAAVEVNLTKDLIYSIVGVLRNVVSPAFVQAGSTGNLIVRMNQRHSLVVIKDILLHFKQVKLYYAAVLQFKHQLHPAVRPSPPT